MLNLTFCCCKCSIENDYIHNASSLFWLENIYYKIAAFTYGDYSISFVNKFAC